MSAQPGDLILLGAGGHAKVACCIADLAGWRIVAVLDDDRHHHGHELLGNRIVGPLDILLELDCSEAQVHLAIGDNRSRSEIALRYPTLRWATLVHPQAFVHRTAVLGDGTLVSAGAVVHPDSRVGRHVIVNTAAIVEHDNIIGDTAHIGPNATLNGAVEVETGAFVGAGAVVLPGCRIGAWATIGAGAVVVRDAPAATVGIGVPCRPIGSDVQVAVVTTHALAVSCLGGLDAGG